MYEVNETEHNFNVCAIQLADIERDVPVTFLAQSQSALRKYSAVLMVTITFKCCAFCSWT